MTITAPAIPGFTFAKTSYEDLVARFLAIPGYTSELLGQSVNGRPIYGFSLGDLSKPTMYVEGNIHGYHEWRTCWWVSEFMKLLADPSLSAPHTAILTDLRARYSFYFIPSVNPDGYGTASTTGPYTNANGVSVSENFDYNWAGGVHTPPNDEYRGPSAWSEPESQIVRDKVLELLPASLLCNHTWSSSTVGWTTRHPQNTADDAAITDFYNSIKATLGYDDAVYNQKFSAKHPTGSAYNWAGKQTSTAGRPIIGQVFESGGGMTVEDQSRVGMTGILYHMLMVDSMLANPVVPPPPVVTSSSWGPLHINGLDYPVTSVARYDGHTLTPVWTA